MPSIKSRLFSTWIYLGAVLVAPLLAPLPADAENDLYARQLASVTAGARSADQQLVAAHAEEEYLRKRQELLRRLEPTNTLSGALGGVAVRTGLTLLIPGGYLPITGGVLAAYAIKSFLDRETARLLLETGRADPELFGQIVESNPGVARAGLAATALRRSSLFSAADNGSGVLLAHGYDVAAHLAGLDFAGDPFWTDILGGAPDDLDAALALVDRDNYVEAVETVGEFRKDLHDRAGQVEDVNRQILRRIPNAAGFPPPDTQAAPPVSDLRREAEELARHMIELDSSGRAVVRMLATTGVLDSEDAGRLQSGLDTIVGVGTTWAGFAAGNPMVAVAGAANTVTGLTGLFSDTEPDVGLALVAELLEGVREQQELILKDLFEARREIARTHLAVLDGRQEVLGALGEVNERLAAQIASGFVSLGDSIREVRWEIGQLAGLLGDYSQLRGSFAGCANFLDSRGRLYPEFQERREPYFALEERERRFGRFASWVSLDQHYRTFAGQWAECMTAMQDVFSTEGARRIHPIFWLAAYPSAGGGTMLGTYVNPGVTPLVRFVNRHYPLEHGRGRRRTFCALLNSPGSYEDIDFRGYETRC